MKLLPNQTDLHISGSDMQSPKGPSNHQPKAAVVLCYWQALTPIAAGQELLSSLESDMRNHLLTPLCDVLEDPCCKHWLKEDVKRLKVSRTFSYSCSAAL